MTILSVPSSYATIQAAITAATNGDIIQLAVGTYTENITINKQITIQGADKTTTIIKSVANASTPTIQLTDGSSGTTISNVTVQCRVTTLSTTGSGNANNSDSGIYIYTTNTSTNPYISNLTFSNLVVKNSSNGICFNNKKSNNILISYCVIEKNEGSGVRIATNTEYIDGFTLDHCTIQNNNLNAINSNPSGTYRPNCTNYTISNCTITNNNKLTVNNSHDISIFGFNGNITVSNTSITSNHIQSKQTNGSSATTGGWGFIIYGSNSSSILRDSGNITLSSVTFNGNVIKSSFGIERYNQLSTIDFNNLDLKNYIPNKANQTWPQTVIGHMDLNHKFNLGNAKLLSLVVGNIGSVDATNCQFYKQDGTLLNINNYTEYLQISDLVYDNSDNNLIGEVSLSQSVVYVNPTTTNSIVDSLNNFTSSENTAPVNTVNLVAGTYTVLDDLSNGGTIPVLLKSVNGVVSIVKS